jgi:hypothetical protein
MAGTLSANSRPNKSELASRHNLDTDSTLADDLDTMRESLIYLGFI